MKLLQFLRLPQEQQLQMLPALKVVKPLANFRKGFFKKKTFGVQKSLTELTFGQVNVIKNLLQEGTTQSLMKAFQIVFPTNPLKMDVVRFYRCLQFIKQDTEKILQMEQKHWMPEPSTHDSTLQQAGINELQKFKDLPLIDNLAQGDFFKYEAIENQNYMKMHIIIWYRTTQQNINQRIQNIIYPKK